MKTIELPRDQWRQFFERLTQLSRGARLKIETQTPEGQTVKLAKDDLFESASFDEQADACSGVILIESSNAGRRPQQHRIIEPIHLRLKDGQNNRYNHIEIVAESGATLITLNPGLEFAGDYARTAAQAMR